MSQIACASCGAPLEYQPGSQPQLHCARCGHVQSIAAAPAAAKDDFRALLVESLAAGHFDERATLTCSTCGAETTLAKDVISSHCPFCRNPAVVGASNRLLRPAAVLPFRLDEKQAHEAVLAWERALWFKPGPGPLFAATEAPPLSAVYLPYWTFDWQVTTAYTGSRGVRVDKDTKWTPVSGVVRTTLDSATVFGSKSVPREEGADLEPWDTENAVAYSDDYLQGISAETSAIDVPEAGDLAHRILEAKVIYDIECQIGGDSQRISDKSIEYDLARVQQILLPVWIGHYTSRGRSFRMLVNARTGEVIGERPISRTKLLSAALTPLAVCAIGAAIVVATNALPSFTPLRAGVAVFWGLLVLQGILSMIFGSFVPKGAPIRQKQFYMTRQAANKLIEWEPVEIWSGVLQDDVRARAALLKSLGFAALFIGIMPGVATVMTAETMPLTMMHGFSALAAAGFIWAIRASFRGKRELLGL